MLAKGGDWFDRSRFPAEGCPFTLLRRQKMYLSATCINRGDAAFTTWPKSLLSISPSTATGPKN